MIASGAMLTPRTEEPDYPIDGRLGDTPQNQLPRVGSGVGEQRAKQRPPSELGVLCVH
jgi:hypothetical protein